MADRAEEDTIHLKCSDSIITCQICMEIFDSPRILPCQHNFCRECVISLIQKHCLLIDGRANGDPFPCPICRQECKIRQNGRLCMEEHLQGFPENLLLKSLLESVVDSEEARLEQVEPNCNDANIQHEDRTRDDLYLLADDESLLRNFFTKYIYFLSTIQYVVTMLNCNELFTGRWTVNRSQGSELSDLVYEICTIPAGKYNIVRFLNLPNFDRADLPSVLSYIEHSEAVISDELRGDWFSDPEDSFGVREAQTQTENMSYCCWCSQFLSFFTSKLNILLDVIFSLSRVPDLDEVYYGTGAILFALGSRALFLVISVVFLSLLCLLLS